MARAALLVALLGLGCVNRFEAPYPAPDYVSIPRSTHSVRLEARGQAGAENCVATSAGQVCVIELRAQLERGVSTMLHNVGIEASPAEYVVTLDVLTFHLQAQPAQRALGPMTELSLTWHVMVRNAATGATLLATGDTETVTTLGSDSVENLFLQAEHDAVMEIETRLNDAMTRL